MFAPVIVPTAMVNNWAASLPLWVEPVLLIPLLLFADWAHHYLIHLVALSGTGTNEQGGATIGFTKTAGAKMATTTTTTTTTTSTPTTTPTHPPPTTTYCYYDYYDYYC